MNELEIRKRNMYTAILFVFRLVLIFFLAYQIMGRFWNDITTEIVTNLFILGIYLLGVTLIPIGRFLIYAETLAVIGLLFWYGEGAFISLFVFPLSVSMMVKVEKLDMLIVPGLSLLMIFFGFGWNPISISFCISLFVFFFIKEYESIEKNEMLKQIKKQVIAKDKELQENEVEMLVKNKELESISTMFIQIKHLNKKIEIDELITDMAESPKKMFNADYVAVYVWDDERFQLLKESGSKRKYDIPKSLSLGEGRQVEISHDFMRYPIMKKGDPWGVIDIYGKKESIYEHGQKVSSRFNEDDYEKIALYVGQVMFSMEHAKTLMKLEHMANNDFLTGVPNRRHFFEKMEYLIRRAERGDELAVVVLDIDDFKRFNDKYGHEKGDETLIVVAEVLQSYVRKMDFVGRLGGEEFGILIPNANKDAVAIAERVRQKVSQIPFVENITVSLGIAYYGKDGTTSQELYNNADKALYYSKGNGKNQVTEYREDL